MANNALAHGFVRWAQLADQRLATLNTREVNEAVTMSAQEHQREINALMSSMVQRTTEFKVRFKLPGGGSMEPLDIEGEASPKVVRVTGYYDVAFPLQAGGTAWGTNIVSAAKMTVAEANRQVLGAQSRDADWVRRHLMAAIFDNVAWTFSDPDQGDLTIQPIANDGSSTTVLYPKVGGALEADNHFLYQAAAIDDDNNPFPTLYAELSEHMGNDGPYVAYIPTNLVSYVEALTAFVPVADPEIVYSANTDQLRSPLPLNVGDQVLGRINKMWIVEWKNLPESYIFAQALGAGPFIYMREMAEPALQGLMVSTVNLDGNHTGYRYRRFAGFGVYNRAAACVMKVGSGSYSIPTGYDAPLAA